jgi:hypothetical protein
MIVVPGFKGESNAALQKRKDDLTSLSQILVKSRQSNSCSGAIVRGAPPQRTRTSGVSLAKTFVGASSSLASRASVATPGISPAN